MESLLLLTAHLEPKFFSREPQTTLRLFKERNIMRLIQSARAIGATVALLALVSGGTVPTQAAASATADLHEAKIRCVDEDTILHELFVTSASENNDRTQVTYPLHTGTSHGETVYYVLTDTSDPGLAALLGINYVPKLVNAKGTAAVQQVTLQGIEKQIIFPATVDFSPDHVLVPGPTGFPPAQADPGAVGEAGYSPLIELPNGIVVNAPHVANDTGQADKVVRLDKKNMLVSYQETSGCYDDETVHYASFDSSDPGAAAIEDVTYAPNLNAAPTLGDESDKSAREGLIAFTNGQTGKNNPQRQGLNSAILDGLNPLNILHEVPEPGNMDYSPLWDPRLAAWTQAAIDQHQNLRQTDFAAVLSLVSQGLITGFPNGTPFRATGFIVNCPVVSLDHTH
jgi:hypothetical protein